MSKTDAYFDAISDVVEAHPITLGVRHSGPFILDAYEGKTLAQMKERAYELCDALDYWQWIAMQLAEKHGTEGLGVKQAKEVEDLIEAYKDHGEF